MDSTLQQMPSNGCKAMCCRGCPVSWQPWQKRECHTTFGRNAHPELTELLEQAPSVGPDGEGLSQADVQEAENRMHPYILHRDQAQ